MALAVVRRPAASSVRDPGRAAGAAGRSGPSETKAAEEVDESTDNALPKGAAVSSSSFKRSCSLHACAKRALMTSNCSIKPSTSACLHINSCDCSATRLSRLWLWDLSSINCRCNSSALLRSMAKASSKDRAASCQDVPSVRPSSSSLSRHSGVRASHCPCAESPSLGLWPAVGASSPPGAADASPAFFAAGDSSTRRQATSSHTSLRCDQRTCNCWCMRTMMLLCWERLLRKASTSSSLETPECGTQRMEQHTFGANKLCAKLAFNFKRSLAPSMPMRLWLSTPRRSPSQNRKRPPALPELDPWRNSAAGTCTSAKCCASPPRKWSLSSAR
mmetsp:Transcript_67981/g.196981  ORF Transcript_67981/g.196981 Transcript_67981/m.196981 type:complete len:332 (+) Transcript_67981:795-1790(+)